MKNIKILSLALAGITLLSAVPVNAYELEDGYSKELVEYQNSEDESFSNETSVFAELKSEYKVTIPKYIVLSGTSKTANYYVKAIGDIAGYERLEVVPDETVTLNSKNKTSQTASINQDKTTWHYDDFDTDANGIIDAKTITAGKWSGTFNFNINLIDGISEVKVLSDIILPPDEWNGQEVMGVAELEASNIMSLDTALSQSIDESLINDVVVTSSDENIVKVDGHKLIPVKDGEAKITTSLNGKSQSFKVRVTNEPTVRQCKHSPNFSTKENITYGEDTGSYDTVTYCRYCGIEMSRETTNYKLKIVGLDTNRNEYDIEQLNIYPGRKQSFRLKLNDTDNAVAKWESTLKDGISVTKIGQDCTMTISDNVPADTEFDLIATYMNATTTKLHIKILDENYIDETGFVQSNFIDNFNGFTYTDPNGVLHVFNRGSSVATHYTYDGISWNTVGDFKEYNIDINASVSKAFEINGEVYLCTKMRSNSCELYKALDDNLTDWQPIEIPVYSNYNGGVKAVVKHNGLLYIFGSNSVNHAYRPDNHWYLTFDGTNFSEIKMLTNISGKGRVMDGVELNGEMYLLVASGTSLSSGCLLCTLNEDTKTIETTPYVLPGLPGNTYITASGRWAIVANKNTAYIVRRSNYGKLVGYKFDGKTVATLPETPDNFYTNQVMIVRNRLYIACTNTKPYNQFYRYNEQDNTWTHARQKP